MRASEFVREEDELNEVMPLIGIAARAAGAAKGMQAARGAANKTQGGNLPAAGATAANPNQQNDTIGEPDDEEEQPVHNPLRKQALDRAKDQMIRPGADVSLPTDGTGGPEEFKVTNIQGDDVEIENPNPAPGEPRRVVYKKDDVKKSMSL